ncbi:MAG: succinate dehydrogenase, cytochrome b556 subunit [Thermomicrobiales bacterium]|nr:succinate dehydrogenase, cytochrome b556 subunit [Thermomicrobiales bacterium]
MASSSGRSRSSYGAGSAGSDQLSWYFFRLSGALLIGLALGHLFITHYLHVPSETDFDFVSKRYANPLWRTFDWLLLMMALWHGVLGVRISITDYVRSAGKRLFGHSVNWAIGAIFTVLGTVTILTFDEEAARNNTGPLAGEKWIGDILGYSLYAFAIVTYVSAVLLGIWVVRQKMAGRPLIYEGDSGQYAWVLHRATGLGIVFFLLVHILDIMLIGLGRDVYDHTVEFYAEPFIIPMEVALVGAVIYHALNGLRIMLIDFWPGGGVKNQRALYYVALIAAVALTIPSAIIILNAEF